MQEFWVNKTGGQVVSTEVAEGGSQVRGCEASTQGLVLGVSQSEARLGKVISRKRRRLHVEETSGGVERWSWQHHWHLLPRPRGPQSAEGHAAKNDWILNC